MEDLREILYAGPYTLNYRPVILKPWTTDFDFNEEFPIWIPIWVKLSKLLMNCWGVNSLSRIASSIVKPIFADECMAKRTRVYYARMLIVVYMTKKLPDEVTIADPNDKVTTQSIIYEGRPTYYEQYQLIDHKYALAPEPKATPKPRWREGYGGPRVVKAWIYKGLFPPL